MPEFPIVDLSFLPAVAAQILQHYNEARVFAVSGQMGAGKTTLIKEFCRQLNVTDTVSSPTFALVYEYQTSGKATVYHFDFYRINNEKEAIDIGASEYFDKGQYCFIEWPEKVLNLLPQNTVHLNIKVENDKRIIRCAD